MRKDGKQISSYSPIPRDDLSKLFRGITGILFMSMKDGSQKCIAQYGSCVDVKCILASGLGCNGQELIDHFLKIDAAFGKESALGEERVVDI